MIFLKKLFQGNKNTKAVDLSLVGVDMHSHLLPGIDDGSPDMETTIFLLKKLAALGYKKAITTPHIMYDLYRNNAETIKDTERKVKEAIAKNNINIEFEAAAEYLIDEGFERLMTENNLLTFGDNYLLVELPYSGEPTNLGRILFDLQIKGYKIILAHPERYSYWHDIPDKYESLKDGGVFFQLNINSITKFHSSSTRKVASWLINQQMIDFLGTDLHSKAYLSAIEKATKDPLLAKLLSSGKLRNVELLMPTT
jgi:protein-tyrosine phosphatase